MSIHVALTHNTSYVYDRQVGLGPQIVRLRPAPHCRTEILAYSLKITPDPHWLNWQQDPQSNWLARIVFPEPVREFRIAVDLIADMAVINPFDFFLEPQVEEYPIDSLYAAWLQRELAPYLEAEPAGPRLREWLSAVPRMNCRTIDFLVDLNRTLQQHIRYLIRLEPGIQTCEETLARGSGSCRDSGWLLVQILRHLGFAARFVSGYLIQLKPDEKPLDGPAGTDVDFTDLHAWAEVYLPGAGWIGLDPTSGLLAAEGHIPLACTPDPASAAPVTGTTGPCQVDFAHHMAVGRIRETPRVTKPYTDAQWQAILALGDRVDAALLAGDVRLTMGGEPTFVSVDDMEAEEWNIAAVGPTKRRLAADLIARLRDRFAPGGVLHFGQGKWYPGESLPRWAFALYWRGDGRPLWHDPSLTAPETPPPNATTGDAERFLTGLARTLGIDEGHVLAAFEDPVHYIAREQMLPPNVDPLDSRLDDAEERDRLARVFERGLGEPAGFVLPIQRWQSRDFAGWRSERWSFRRRRLFLVPGDSPAGFRLPLGSLPWVPASVYPYDTPLDPFAERSELPELPRPQEPPRRQPPLPRAGAEHRHWPLAQGGEGLEVGGLVRTAITVEARDGQLCVFLPPLDAADDFVSLVNAIETTAAETGLAVHLEGYTPPPDPRLNVIKVTPDPGVIEVNVHPAANWQELVEITTALYEEARQTRLGTEKFMLDGRHSGTGGGNHIVVGGPTPGDSPFLRRPDLLRSLIGYWQNHPALSYLFSGLFIGPTSQAPRVDEARTDALHELELAFRQIPDPGEGWIPLWLIDRVLRNLLVDVSGNTHRAEICIDKLYSPDGPSGRLGLVEFRAFEMPPHARMSSAQQLLLRALIAWFWQAPYHKPLVRWSTALHDRFMLPHFVWADFLDVLRDLETAGFSFEPEWFAPHFEFRFPVCGRVQSDGVGIELRTALEPWHVLGEEGATGGTARYVDSSLERLQVRAIGAVADRHALTCNGHRLPLHPTGVEGEAVAGVRFRAWQPPSCLHPTIPVDSPLTFDIVDTWSERSLGGCVYHVAHPGGRGYDIFPVNAFEAEARRRTRFSVLGHSPGRVRPAPAPANREHPLTLDLRWTHVAPRPAGPA